MKCNVILEASRVIEGGDISNWHGATLLNGGYIHFSPNISNRKRDWPIVLKSAVKTLGYDVYAG
jgi:hypothetical protein